MGVLYASPVHGPVKLLMWSVCDGLSWLQVDTRKELPSGSEQEVEIRACTVIAVEHLRDALAARYGAVAAPDGRHAVSAPSRSASDDGASAGEPCRTRLP